MKPLSGIRVLELARILAGPWCGQLLADLGAEVLKVERPGAGDDTRGWGPPYVTTADGSDWGAAYYHAANRGKSSIAVDFHTPEGQAIIRELVKSADIVVENFKVGGLKKYGLDHDSLKAINPRIITCSITGFGQDGPYAARAGYDIMIQGMCGLMDITGAEGEEPQKVGVAVVDVFTGVYATVGILAALRKRDETGEGSHVDLALLDVGVSVLANLAMNYLVTGNSPKRRGNSHASIVPYQAFEVADGHMILAVGNDSQFQHYCAAIGATDIANDPDYLTNDGRVIHRKALVAKLQPIMKTIPRDDLLARLEKVGVPAGPINSIADVFADAQVIHRGLKLELVDVDGSSVPGVASPIVIDGKRMVSDRPSPMLGADTDTILRALSNPGN